MSFTLDRHKVGLIVVDMQEALFSVMEDKESLEEACVKMVNGFQVFERPILYTEQYPQGLKGTIESLRDEQNYSITKTTFSACDTHEFLEKIHSMPVQQWVLVGIEAHVCVLMTAKDLVKEGKEVVVVADATSSRKERDCQLALDEMRHAGVRVASLETVLFELLKDAKDDAFKNISQLVK